MKRKVFVFISVLFVVLLCTSCSKQQGTTGVKNKTLYSYFDTVITISSYANETDKHFDEICSQIEKLYDRYNRLFDIFHEYSGLENLCSLNRQAGSAVKVDADIIELLEYSKQGYYLTNGEMNVMMGSVLKLWKEKNPSQSELDQAGLHVDVESLQINKAEGTAVITDPLASVDVGAVAKGFATEKVAQYLISQGVTGYIINAGGNVRLIGEKPSDTDWKIAIRNPSGETEYAKVYSLHDTSCVTSGSYERANHIIDKDTFMPADYFDSVSIITADSAYADVLSTALFCMSREEGLEFAKQRGDFNVLWIMKDGEQFEYEN